MNSDILIEKIKYLSSLPHSSLVEHCIYLENENDNYKAQKYITDFISENGIICEKNKEIKRLNNIIDELEKWCDIQFDVYKDLDKIQDSRISCQYLKVKDKLKELKDKNE